MNVAEKSVSKTGGRPAAREAGAAGTMETKGFSTAFTVEQSPQAVFDAINDVRGWWSGRIDGVTDRLGAEFTYRFKGLHRSTQKVTELVPGKRVVWHVADSTLSFVQEKTEWDGTDIVFEINRKGDRTEVRFTHVGLLPRLQCYGACAEGWRFYVNDSLRSLIATGKGDPDPKER